MSPLPRQHDSYVFLGQCEHLRLLDKFWEKLDAEAMVRDEVLY